jgi:hypothetical protein
MSDLSFGSFPDLLESNTLSSTSGEINNFEQSTITNSNEQNKCAVSIYFIYQFKDLFLYFYLV